MIQTWRLKELEEDRITRARSTGPATFKYLAEGRAEGYKMALEDLQPVIEAAIKLNGFDNVATNGGSETFKALRDALAALEAE